MKKYSVTFNQGVTFHTGKMYLTADQIDKRINRLNVLNVSSGFVEIISPVDFKVGEVVYMDKIDRYLETVANVVKNANNK